MALLPKVRISPTPVSGERPLHELALARRDGLRERRPDRCVAGRQGGIAADGKCAFQ